MADSIGDIELTGEEWLDTYSLTGFSKLTGINIQNKSSDYVFILVKATKPDLSKLKLEQGIVLLPFQIFTLPPAQSGCWVKGTGQIHIWQ